MRLRFLPLATAFLLGSVSSLLAGPFVTVTQERQGPNVSLYANLQGATCASAEMALTFTNFRSSAPVPIVRELTQPKTLLTILTRIDPAQKPTFKYRFHYVTGRTNAKPDLAHVYKLPFSLGAKYPLRAGYGVRPNRPSSANEYMLVWDMPAGTPVLAARDGIVVAIRDDSNEHGMTDGCRNKANLVVIEHADGTIAEYVHLKLHGSAVNLGQLVKPGDLVGYSGNTGLSKDPNLLVRISRVNPAAARESLAAIWDTKDDYRTTPQGTEEEKTIDQTSSDKSTDAGK